MQLMHLQTFVVLHKVLRIFLNPLVINQQPIKFFNIWVIYLFENRLMPLALCALIIDNRLWVLPTEFQKNLRRRRDFFHKSFGWGILRMLKPWVSIVRLYLMKFNASIQTVESVFFFKITIIKKFWTKFLYERFTLRD